MDLGWGDAYDSYRSSKGWFLQEVYHVQLHIPCPLRVTLLRFHFKWTWLFGVFSSTWSRSDVASHPFFSELMVVLPWGFACDRKWISKWQRCLFIVHVLECAPGSAGHCSLPHWNSLPSVLQLGTKGATLKGGRVPQPPNWLNLCLPMLFASMLINVNYGSGACDVLIIKAILFFCACTVCHTIEPWLGFPRCYK